MPRKHAFTLIELLVVVAIIVALIAILMPSMSRAIEASYQAVCGSQQHQLSMAMLAKAADSAGRLPASQTSSQYSTVAQAWGKTPALDILDNYLGGQVETFFCPGFMSNNTNYYTEEEDFFEFSNSWRNWLPNRRITSYYCGTAVILDPATNPYSHFGYPNGPQRVTSLASAKSGDMLLADVTLSVTNNFYVTGFVGFSSPPHTNGVDGDPRGGNVTSVDGSAVWRGFDDMLLRYTYVDSNPSGLRQYWW